MKLMNKLFAAFVLFGMSNAAFGYNFTFTNTTNKAVNVKIDLVGVAGSYEKLLQPKETSTFSIQDQYASYCLRGISLNNKATSFHGIVDNQPIEASSMCKDASFVINEMTSSLESLEAKGSKLALTLK